jgi:hypothetical protein
MKRLLIAAVLVLSATSASAQITTPNTLQAGAIIRAAELNTNFSTLGTKALNRLTGGVIEGNVTLNADITFDGVDISDFLLSTGEVRTQTAGTAAAPAFARSGDATTGIFWPTTSEIAFALGGIEKVKFHGNGITAYGTTIINSAGKIPALTGTYFASLDGSALTSLNGSNISSGTVADGRLSTNVPLKNGTNSFSGTNTFGGLITGTLQVTGGTPATGQVLTSDAVGSATWQTPGATQGAVPSGMIGMFDTTCPMGWTRFAALDGKFARGAATYGGIGGADTHVHAVDVPATASSSEGAHTHAVDPPLTASDAEAAHTHGVGAGTTGSSSVNHVHGGTAQTSGSHTHTVATSGTAVQTGSGESVAASTTYTSSSHAGHTHNLATGQPDSSSHSHSFDPPTTVGGSAHAHNTDVGAFTSGAGSGHAHSTDAAAFDSASGSTLPSYVEVIYCKKD